MKSTPKIHKRLLIYVLLVSVVLRISLSLFNYQADDNHLKVAKIIMKEERLPTREDCWQCFQPKLYHCFVAATLKLLPFKRYIFQIRIAQLINCIAGIITLWVIYLFLRSRPLNDKCKLICFSLVALNPKLIGINSMATNDSFVILFSTLALYSALLFLKKNRLLYFLLMTICAILAGLSKGNGLIIFMGIFLILLLKLLLNVPYSLNTKKSYLFYFIIFFLTYLAIVPAFGQYAYNYYRYGSPFVTNRERAPLPHFFKETYTNRPGVTSIVHSYLTFRFIGLLKSPINTPGKTKNYSLHRTSLWSQLYGRTHSTRFDCSPPAWRSKEKIVVITTRIIFLLALMPTFLLLIGVLKEGAFLTSHIIKRKFDVILKSDNLILDVFFYGYIAFIIIYTIKYRDFADMKTRFLFPAILSFLNLFAHGCNYVYTIYIKNKRLIRSFDILLGILCLFYTIDIILLITNEPLINNFLKFLSKFTAS